MRPAILHLCDLGVGIVRVRPVVIGPLLLASPIDPRQIGARRGPNAGRVHERRQKLLIALTGVTPNDAPQRRVRFERRPVDADRLALDQAGLLRHCSTQVKTARCVSSAISRRVREIVEWSGGASSRQTPRKRNAKEFAARQAMPRSESMPSIADQQEPKIDARRHARSSHRFRVEARALGFDEIVKPMLVQQLIEPSSIERVTRSRRQGRRRHPHGRLSLAFVFAHRHGTHCSTRP